MAYETYNIVTQDIIFKYVDDAHEKYLPDLAIDVREVERRRKAI